MDTNIKRCESDSPNRCQASNARGDQCMNQGMEIREGVYAKYCSMHGGVSEYKKNEEKSKNMYRLAKYGQRVGEFAGHNQVKGLRDEIGILRMILEERLNKCNDDQELLLSSGAISDLVVKIEKLVSSCHKLESSMGQLLDKQQVLQFAECIIAVISSEIQDAALLARLANKIEVATESQLSGVERQHAEAKITPLQTNLD